MFFYFYDTFVTDKAYATTLNAIESRIIELGINGRVEKLTPLRNMKELLEAGLKHEAHTVVVVGNDATFIRALNIVASYPTILGYIPFPGPTVLGTIFGLGNSLTACDVLSRRIVTAVNLAKANQSYFLGTLIVDNATTLKVGCDDHYTITNQAAIAKLAIENFGNITSSSQSNQIYGKHSKLHLTLQPLKTKRSLFKQTTVPQIPTQVFANKFTLTHLEQPLTVTIDGEIKLKTPLTITLKPKQLKIIVGKDRLIR